MPDGVARGGAWLLGGTAAADVFTPEKLSDEHTLIARTTERFVEAEVLPALERLEAQDWELARTLIRRAGELGILGTAVPEEYGGLDLDKAASMVVAERIARSASFATTYGGQANLCILPIVLFGTAAQKAKYLPRLVTGELVGAYALSESGSGSDALAARTRATREADGSWTLDGEKMWITNGGFADVIIVFAQAGGDRLTAFIVERSFPGVSSGPEEHKMGLHGSSTTPILLQAAKVPAENVLGAVGRGHKVALNTLNYGRFSLGAMCTGGCRVAVGDAARYAAERRQFGQPIARFGAIRHKLGEMVARTYAAESLTYRTAGLIDAALANTSRDGAAVAAAFEEFAVEASIAKIAGSEALDYVLDENIQIHGGNGFVRDYPAERYYRDARVNRIFEGTNEINRLLVPGLLVRRAIKGELPLIDAARRLEEELRQEPSGADAAPVAGFRKAVLLVLGTAVQRFGGKLADEQEVLAAVADMIVETFASESALLRAQAAAAAGQGRADVHDAAARVYVNDAAMRIEQAGRSALAAMLDGDGLRARLAALGRLLRIMPVNTVALRRQLADAAVARGRYILD